MKRTAEAKLIHFVGGYPSRLHFRSDLHLARKAWHMIMGLVIVFYYLSGMSRGTAVTILSSVLGLDLILETIRLKSTSFNDKIMKFWSPFMRAHEVTQLSTIPHYLSAVILAIAIFPKPVAILSILYLACGDPIASLFGILYGHRGPKLASGKTVIGSAAGVMACFFVSFFYLKSLPMGEGSILALSVIGGLAGGLVELLPFEVDDNFTIPVISGFVMWLSFMLIGF